MTQEMILQVRTILMGGAVIFGSGIFFGLVVYAFVVEQFRSKGYKAADHDKSQAEMDELFGTGTEAGVLRTL